jgi:hypothetical protein
MPQRIKVSRRPTDQLSMDARREPRFNINQSVSVTNLGVPGEALPGKIVNFSARGIRLLLEKEIVVGAIIKVELATTLLLGQVTYCIPEDAQFSVGMELEEAVYDTLLFAPKSEDKSKDITSEQS